MAFAYAVNPLTSVEGHRWDIEGLWKLLEKEQKMNRLTSAAYKASSGNNIFNEQIGYDEIGNITSLNRKGKVPGDVLNNLTYNYDSSTERGNKLLSVNDSGTEGYSSTYSYDADGNVTADSKKQISTISYNYLGLPRMLTFATGKSIEFIYNAAGRKLARIIRQGTTVAESRNYAAGIEYVDYALQFVQTPEGRAVPSGTDYVYEYYLTDHQGNIRALVGDKNNNGQFDQATDLLQVTDYYPFGRQINHGLQLVSNPANNYGFSGKELLGDLGQLDYGARFYDPVVGRWNAADPLADMAADWTPYRYGFNNPIRYTDPSGLYEVENGNIFITDQAEITRFLEYLGEHPEASTKDMSDYVISADNGFAWALKEVTVGGAATYDNAISNAQEQVANVVRSISDFNGSINYGQVDNKGEGYEQTDLHEYSQWGRKVSGYLLAASLPLEQAFKRASLYSPPTSGSTVNIIYEKKILGQRVIHGSLGEMNAIRAGKIANGLKIASKVVGVAGVAFAGADMIRNGVTTSNSLDLAMSGLALSGFGTGVAGTYFLLNAGSIYFTNKDLGQHIDGYIK